MVIFFLADPPLYLSIFLVKSSAKYSFYGVGKWRSVTDIVYHVETTTLSYEILLTSIKKVHTPGSVTSLPTLIIVNVVFRTLSFRQTPTETCENCDNVNANKGNEISSMISV